MMMHHREKNVLAFVGSLRVFLTNQELRLIVCYQERFRMPLSAWFREFSGARGGRLCSVGYFSRKLTLILSPATVHVALLSIFEAVVVVLFADAPSWQHF